jgi:phosphatidylserine decarboxylase
MVGAFGVGRIANVFDERRSNTSIRAFDAPLNPPPDVQRGDELGRFELGSTVILLCEAGRVDWTMDAGQVLRLGRPIATAR